MKRSAAAILVFMFVATALLAARSNARSHPNGVLKTIEQGDITSFNDDYFQGRPCDVCGTCARSMPRLCHCEDVTLLGCREGCGICQPVLSPPGFRCLDMAYYECKNYGHRFAEPAATVITTTTTESIN
ncbi:uncharacterized protein A4U43_C07F1210 [Asparagus officinalis]|uniref:Bowman-Birk serine protease inhibitors family domain-containing protein n=1 Tax=Asparagus officinalis TaxID=4686 RepID=A0A5P1EDE2_ASPOF|nr:Bowman-Birk type proteinase inhibitor D-II-like [Asparagus officinalis]ONK62180.1 uncharacterized protein A4U43_C07F1210 [Asparagus officinalis]